MEGLPRISQSKHGYNELLYAHLLDGEGQRLTYTHFTAKVDNVDILASPVLSPLDSFISHNCPCRSIGTP